MDHLRLNMVLDALVEGLSLMDKPLAREILRAVSDPGNTNVPVRYSMPFIRGVLGHVMPHDDPDGFVNHAIDFLLKNEHDVDYGNRLGGDHEAISMAALVDRYVALLNQQNGEPT